MRGREGGIVNTNLSAVRMKAVKNSSMGEKVGGGRGPLLPVDGRKKRSVNL